MVLQLQPQVSMTIDDYEPLADSDCEPSSSESSSRQFQDFARSGMARLDLDGNIGCCSTKKRFPEIMASVGIEVNVDAIHQYSHPSGTWQARKKSFMIFQQAMASKRGGDANVKYAWYGGDREEILGIVTHGFSRCGNFDGGVSHGIGVNLSPDNVLFYSAMKAKGDENGVGHVLLCLVILGKAETIAAGSRVFQPSSSDFDSGVDDLLSPRNYTIWSAYMNSHIFPFQIISFTSPVFAVRMLPNNGPRFKLQTILNVLSRFLHPSRMALIWSSCNEFLEHKIDRVKLVRRLRRWVEDQLIVAAFNLCIIEKTESMEEAI